MMKPLNRAAKIHPFPYNSFMAGFDSSIPSVPSPEKDKDPQESAT
ncbi:MAG: hypothetical protein PHQ65_10790 [Bacteroidales bacterium]|nr:hypothetical protein [Bacteroidales bacterium]MDD3665740.1 hypothetical protein [Bacteroidales bacterium]